MNVVGVMAAYLPWCVYVLHSLESASLDCAVHSKYAVITPTTSISTIHRTITVILAKHCIELPHDRSLAIRNMLEQIANILNIL